MLDPALILCENCGYDIGSLEQRLSAQPDLKCPECAKPIAESLPKHRTGSPWQVHATPLSWLTTGAAVLRHPIRVWRTVRPGQGRLQALMWLNLLVAAFAFGALVRTDRHVRWNDGLEWYIGVPLTSSPILLALVALSLIEWGGIRFFGRRRGWRRAGKTALAVVAHAAVGWCIGPFAGALAWITARAVGWKGWGTIRVSHSANWGPGYSMYPELSQAVAVVTSLLAFVTLSYLGFRAMRFANHPRTTTPTAVIP